MSADARCHSLYHLLMCQVLDVTGCVLRVWDTACAVTSDRVLIRNISAVALGGQRVPAASSRAGAAVLPATPRRRAQKTEGAGKSDKNNSSGARRQQAAVPTHVRTE